MYLCVYVYICVCMYVYIMYVLYMCMCLYVYIYIRVCVCVCVCVDNCTPQLSNMLAVSSDIPQLYGGMCDMYTLMYCYCISYIPTQAVLSNSSSAPFRCSPATALSGYAENGSRACITISVPRIRPVLQQYCCIAKLSCGLFGYNEM